MSAVSVQAPLSQYKEALAYWDELTLQCRRHIKAINALVAGSRQPEEDGVAWKPQQLGVMMTRAHYPSTEISLRLLFEQWGPKISISVRGLQEPDLRFYPEEFDFAIACDQHDEMVAITGEGGSLTPHELAKYITQNFRRCYPGITLPSPETPFE